MMIEICKFGPDAQARAPMIGAPGVSAVPIQAPAVLAEALAQSSPPLASLPILLDRQNSVGALYLDAQSGMDEIDTPEPILFLVVSGRGFVRLGGPQGETAEVSAGDAVLWPADVMHKAWTTEEPLQAVVVHYAAEVRSP